MNYFILNIFIPALTALALLHVIGYKWGLKYKYNSKAPSFMPPFCEWCFLFWSILLYQIFINDNPIPLDLVNTFASTYVAFLIFISSKIYE